MRPTPARLGIESFLLPFDAFPAKKMKPIVLSDRFNHMIGFTIALLATTHHVFNYVHILQFSPRLSNYELVPIELSHEILEYLQFRS